MTIQTTTPRLQTGTWEIDPAHSSVEFSVRHVMVAKVKGRFASFRGAIEIADDPLESRVEAAIDLASVDTHDEKRDGHLRSPDFFDVERYPHMTFVSRRVRPERGRYVVEGDLELHGVRRPLALDLEFHGVGTDPYGNVRAGFTATTELNRKDFGLEWNVALDGGGVLVSEKIKINLDIQLVKAA